jgi:short-subunit dehydrogenase
VADLQRVTARLDNADAPIDILVNNAGIIVPGAVGTLDDDLMRAHVDINMTAPMLLCATAAGGMKQWRSGHIVSIMSLQAIGPMKDSACYSASKFGLRRFMASLSLELYGTGVGWAASSRVPLTHPCWLQKWRTLMGRL